MSTPWTWWVKHLRAIDLRIAVRREPHHLPLVAVLREAEPLRERRVVDPERMRERDAVEHLERVPAAVREQRGCEVAEPVHRQDGGLVEGRDEERGRRVREVVLDAVELGAKRVR
jgi:hypothetical protein